MKAVWAALAVVATLAVIAGTAASANAQTSAPDGYTSLLFDPLDTKYVFRLGGTPWICRGDTFCKQVKIDGVADKDAAQARIDPLGVAGARYYLSYQQANFEKGKSVVLSCLEERCGRLDTVVGDTAALGTFEVKQDGKIVTRTALLRRLDARGGRAQMLWCNDNGCAELPLTRDTESYLTFMRKARGGDGRTMAWLADRRRRQALSGVCRMGRSIAQARRRPAGHAAADGQCADAGAWAGTGDRSAAAARQS
jgi:hypothetical protein